jgi:hypothetical protein
MIMSRPGAWLSFIGAGELFFSAAETTSGLARNQQIARLATIIVKPR